MAAIAGLSNQIMTGATPTKFLTPRETLQEIMQQWDAGVEKAPLLAKYGGQALNEAAVFIDEKRQESIPGAVDRFAAGFGKDAQEEVDILNKRGFLASVGEVAPGMLSKAAGALTFGAIGGQPTQEAFVNGRQVDPPGWDMPGDLADLGGLAARNIPPAVAGTAGFIGSRGNLKVASAAAGAGGVVGENLRQAGAAYFGGQQEPELARIGTEGALDAVTEPLAGIGAKAFRGLSAPLKGKVTAPIQRKVIDPAKAFDQEFGTDAMGTMPIGGQTASRGMQKAEQRVAEGSFTAETYRVNVLEPFEENIKKIFGGIQGKVGATTGSKTTGEAVRSAAEQAQALRIEQITQANDHLDSIIDPIMQVRPDNARGALEEMARSSRANPKFNTTAKAAEQIQSWMSDLENIENYGDLRDLRRSIGETMLSPQRMDEFMRSGLNGQVAHFYSALMRDVEAALPSDIVPVEAHVRGLTSSAHELQQSSAARRTLGNEDKASNITEQIMSKNFTPEEVMRQRQVMGEHGTTAGLKITPEGDNAWRQVQTEILEMLRQASINRDRTLEEGLSGELMVSQIRKMGGLPKLKAVFGDELGDQINRFSVMLRESNRGSRTMGNTSRTGEAIEFMHDMARLFTNPPAGLAGIAAKVGLGQAVTSRGGRKFLTEGVLQDATSQNLLSNIGRAVSRSTINENRK